MEEVKTLAMVAGNLGGMGALAWCLLHLHREALKIFREELRSERELFSEAIDKAAAAFSEQQTLLTRMELTLRSVRGHQVAQGEKK